MHGENVKTPCAPIASVKHEGSSFQEFPPAVTEKNCQSEMKALSARKKISAADDLVAKCLRNLRIITKDDDFECLG